MHRHLHESGASVYAYTDELAAWRALRYPAVLTKALDEEQAGSSTERDARALYLMSRYQWAQRTSDGFQKSIALARTALQRHPDFAPAHAMLALAYATRASYGNAPPEEDLRLAHASATAALRMDPTVVEAHQALGFLQLCFEWDWPSARASFERALDLDARDPTTYQWLSFWHIARNDDGEACRAARRAEELAPGSLILAAHYSWILHLVGRLDDSIATANAVIRRSPHFWRGYFNLALSLVSVARYREAARAIEMAVALSDQSCLFGMLSHALAAAGDRDRARNLIANLTAAGTYMAPFWKAYAAMGFGDRDGVLQHLAESVSARDWFVIFMTHEPTFSALRQREDFDKLRCQVGLPCSGSGPSPRPGTRSLPCAIGAFRDGAK
jgi:tetratricopeptide (TPR) repeat protein